MKAAISSICPILVLSVFSFGFLWPTLATAEAADPFIGTWKMDLSRSNFTYPAPKSYTIRFSTQENGVKAIEDVVEADGKTIHRGWTAKYDGKDYPFVLAEYVIPAGGDNSGNRRVHTAPEIDAISLKRPDANTLDYVCKKNGREVWRGRSVVYNDGRTLTIKGEGKDDQAQPFTFDIFLEKK